jgi:hypothetical protein
LKLRIYIKGIAEEMRKSSHWKKVFCLEGLWSNNLKDSSSVEPMLSFICGTAYNFDYIYRDAATVGEFQFYLQKSCQAQYKDYPILYLAFHGEEEHLHLADGKMSLDELSSDELLGGKCNNKIIVMGSCSTLNIDKRKIKSFLKKTGALAVCGYRTDVDWMQGSAFEMLMLYAMQDNEFSGRGIEAIADSVKKQAKRFPELEFRMVTQKEL